MYVDIHNKNEPVSERRVKEVRMLGNALFAHLTVGSKLGDLYSKEAGREVTSRDFEEAMLVTHGILPARPDA